MVVLVTTKKDEDPINNEGDRIFTTQHINFSSTQGQLITESNFGDFMIHVVRVTCKYEKDLRLNHCPMEGSYL